MTKLQPHVIPELSIEDEENIVVEHEPRFAEENGGASDDFFSDNTPSWFVRSHDLVPPENPEEDFLDQPRVSPAPDDDDLEAAYTRYRQRLEERFKMAQHVADPRFSPTRAPQSVPPQHAPSPRAQRNFIPVAARIAPPQRHVRKGNQSGSVFGVGMPTAIMLTALACGIGSAGGYFIANPGALPKMANLTLISIDGWLGNKNVQSAGDDNKLQKPKAIKTAEVSVSDVSGAVNAPISLDISALPTDVSKPISLKITGLPKDAYLTTGIQTRPGEWMLKPEEIRDAQLIVQRAAQPELGLLVTALDAKTGVVAAPSKSMKVALDLNAVAVPGLQPPQGSRKKLDVTVTPVAAPASTSTALPQPVPPPNEVLQGGAASFLEKGDMLLKVGDLIAARQFYLQAYEMNDPAGAYGVAQTYDPKVYAALNVRGLSPDGQQALEWYGKAAAGGHAGAAKVLAQPPQ